MTIKDLIDMYDSTNLDLNPPYQRNEIWSMQSKKLLINSIKLGFPLPNFFILEKNDHKYEMVDGQQRTRTIIGYFKGFFPDEKQKFYEADLYKEFLEYKLSVIYISDLDKSEKIEVFYARVNSTGLKLNRPELNKAKYFDTRFLNLLEYLSENEEFKNLNLFSDKSLERMNNVDFVGELISLIENGITEKKIGVDKLFEQDINEEDFERLKDIFLLIISIFQRFDNIFPIKGTRYKQKNDFYTLFGFINDNLDLKVDTLELFYIILVLINEEISPSNEDCEPFAEYALHCVSQSNSKNAREERLRFLNDLLLNENEKPNRPQSEISRYYEMESEPLISVEKFYTISAGKLQKIVKEPFLI